MVKIKPCRHFVNKVMLVLETSTENHTSQLMKETFQQLTSPVDNVTLLTKCLQGLILTNLLNGTTVKPGSKGNFNF